MEELEGALAVDGVGAGEPFDLASIADSEPSLVQVADFGEFVCHGFVGSDAVEVAAFDHERARGDQCRHLGIIESVAQVELEDFVFPGPDIAVRALRRGVLPYPLIKVRRANRQAVIAHQGRYPHRCLAAVGESVERYASGIYEGQRAKPVYNLLMLRHDD